MAKNRQAAANATASAGAQAPAKLFASWEVGLPAELTEEDRLTAMTNVKAYVGKDLKRLEKDQMHHLLGAITRILPQRTYLYPCGISPWHIWQLDKQGQPPNAVKSRGWFFTGVLCSVRSYGGFLPQLQTPCGRSARNGRS
jgi:hypothetical protein